VPSRNSKAHDSIQCSQRSIASQALIMLEGTSEFAKKWRMCGSWAIRRGTRACPPFL